MSKEIYEGLMETAGWERKTDDGEAYFALGLEDRVMRSFPKFSKVPDGFLLRDGAQVWFQEFALVGAHIFGDDPDFWSLTRRKNSEFRTNGDASPAFFKDVTDKLIAWAMSIDQRDAVEKHALVKPKYGLTSSSHVAALAMLGYVDRLKEFKAEIAANGKAEALHSMVDAAAIDKAIAMGNAVASGVSPLNYLSDL